MEQEKSKKNSNKKIFWIVFYAVLAVLLCYMFVVIYFYYISPNNIALKLKIWPFQSDSAIGEMYSDATVQIDFQMTDPQTEESTQQTLVGVNVRSNGVIVTLYDKLRFYDGSEMTISTSKGVYSGKLLYGDINYNLAVIKCENKEGKNGSISLPYVNVDSYILENEDIFAISSPKESANVRQGTILGQSKYIWQKEITYSGAVGIDFALKNNFVFAFSGRYKSMSQTYTGGGVFDRDGNLLGFYVGYSLDEGGYVCTPAAPVTKFLSKVLDAYNKQTTYQNPMLAAMQVVDWYDAEAHLQMSRYGADSNKNSFYYNGEPRGWRGYTDEMYQFETNNVQSVFLLDDFKYDDRTILEKGNVIVKIKVNERAYVIENKLDFVNLIYSLKSGQKIKLVYTTVNDTIHEEETEEFLF